MADLSGVRVGPPRSVRRMNWWRVRRRPRNLSDDAPRSMNFCKITSAGHPRWKPTRASVSSIGRVRAPRHRLALLAIFPHVADLRLYELLEHAKHATATLRLRALLFPPVHPSATLTPQEELVDQDQHRRDGDEIETDLHENRDVHGCPWLMGKHRT